MISFESILNVELSKRNKNVAFINKKVHNRSLNISPVNIELHNYLININKNIKTYNRGANLIWG